MPPELDPNTLPDIDSDQIQDPPEQTALDVVNAAIDGVSQGSEEFTPAEKKEEAPVVVAEKPAEAAPKAEAKPEEDLTKMPEGLGEKAQVRFQKLAEGVKERDGKIEQLTAQVTEIQEAHNWLRENVLTDEQAASDLVVFADYRKALVSGDFGSAMQILQEQANQLALASGQQVQVDPLNSFPDLRQRVNELQLDMPTALEIARSRQQQHIGMQQRQQEQERTAQHEQFQQAANDTITKIDQMAMQWSKTDPDYAAKEAIILRQIPQLMQTMPVHLVPNQVRILYESLSSVQAPQPRSNVAPLRPTGAAGGSAKPQSAQEAIDQALGYR